MQRSLSAPGKLFISGEYAVLWGGQARVVAVGPRTHALVRRRMDTEIHLLLEEGRCSGKVTPVGVNWLETPVPAPFRFAAGALDLGLRTLVRESVGFDLALSPSPPGPGGQELGTGGSARAAVLAAEAVRYVTEQRWDPLKLALLAHWEAQGSKGSGADVVAIFAGGFVRYRRYDVAALAQAALGGRLGAALLAAPPVEVLRLSAPKVLLSYVFTGASASTPSLVRQMESKLDEKAREDFVAQSDGLGSELEEAMLRGDFARVTHATSALHQALAQLGPVETPAMKRILALASAMGSVGKVSGAGGGDGCVVFSPDPESQRQMLDALQERGFWGSPLTLEAGLQGEILVDSALQRWL